MYIKLVMPSKHLILFIPFSFCLQSFPASGSFQMSQFFPSGSQSIGGSTSASVLPMNTQDWSISFRKDWLDLLAGQGILKSLLQHHSSKASILWRSAFFIVQLSHPYMTTGRTIALTRCPFVGKVMSLLFNMLSRLVITFLPRSKYLLMSWLQWPSAMILESPQIQSVTVSTVSPSICHEVMDPAPRVLTTILISLLKVGKLRHKSVTWLERRTGQHVCRAAVRQGVSLLILTADPSGTRVLPWRAWSQTAKREGEFTPKGLDFLLQEPVVFYLFFNLCLLLLLLLFIVIILIFATWLLPSGYCRAST